MFGMPLPKRRNPFTNPWQTPPFNPQAQMPEIGPGMPQQQPAPQHGGGFMSRLPDGMANIGSILDDDDNGRSMMLRQQAAQEAEQARASAEAENRQWYEREDYKARNRPPPDPYRWRNNNGDLMELGTDGKPRVAYDDPKDKTEWIQVRDPLTGEIRIIPQGGAGGSTPPDVLPPDFDFGEGGPASQAPGGFPAGY